ncbi:BTAD domain-containing putative transcriptional regulator [Streptomyces sp. NPDC051567]|uniref:AfsR/SARP family transcriptional regulator n=1 Tax=Streptomyces sp. NPDC051567 TaxID=3365660 RepID=UPI00378F0443
MAAEQPVPLGGTKPRATLGYLLLQANQVVPTSQLLAALWSADNAPVTARKILQNAVWGLRGTLNQFGAGADGAPAELVTRAPGYMIRVDPDHVDLHLFRQRVRQGRAQLAGGAPHEAVRLLCEALELWRGPVLSDLVETGTMWPELTAVQNTRLDVLEDYFEAKLQCGEHYAVLGELETTVEAEPLRERSSGQLMLALYRCGRQADALSVYNRIRATLVEDLGLEPGHELRRLQQAILAHDPALNLAPAAVVLGGPVPVGVPGGQVRRREDRRRVLAAVPTHPQGFQSVERPPAPARSAPVRRPSAPGPVVTERQRISVLLVQTRIAPEPPGAAPDFMDEMFESVNAIARKRIERFGGVAVTSIGAVSLGLFRAGGEESTAVRAVHAAAAIRDRLTDPAAEAGLSLSPWRGLTLHASVATGQALVRFRPDDPSVPPSVNGALLDTCQCLLALSTAGEIQICDATREAIESAVAPGLMAGSPLSGPALGMLSERGPAAGVWAV